MAKSTLFRLETLLFLFIGFLALGCKDDLHVTPIQGCSSVGETQSCTAEVGCSGTQTCVVVNDCESSSDPYCEERREWGPCVDRVDEECGGDVGACRKGTLVCQEGQYTCGGDFVRPVAEDCNGIDDDCDGTIDDSPDVLNSPHPVSPDFSFDENNRCYSGPEGTADQGICRSALPECHQAQWTCGVETHPAAANCFNGLDNDCDGQVDAMSEQYQGQFDIVLFLDRSSSMDRYRVKIFDALQAFGQAILNSPNNDRIRFTIVEVPGPVEKNCGVSEPFGQNGGFMDIATTLERLQFLALNHPHASYEPSWDCPYLAADPAPDLSMGLNYRPTAQKIFISFTDEMGQSYLDRTIDEEIVAQALADKGVVFHSFNTIVNNGNVQGNPTLDFDDIVSRTGGQQFRLDQDANQLTEDLKSLLFTTICQ